MDPFFCSTLTVRPKSGKGWCWRTKNGQTRLVPDPPITFHGLRHGFASLAPEAGVPLLEVSRILGHHSPEFTARQYAYVADRRLVAGAERLGEYRRERAVATG